MVANTNGKTWWADTICCQIVECMFYDAIFQTVEGDDGNSAIGIQKVNGIVQKLFQPVQLLVDFDTKCLEGAFGWVSALFANGKWDGLFDDCNKLSATFDWCFLTLDYNVFCNVFCKVIFALVANDCVQFVFVVGVDDCFRS